MKKVYEVVPEGFNGGTDVTDHLIKWVAADSVEQVAEVFPRHKEINDISDTVAPSDPAVDEIL